jgi:hypothetical protein
MRRIKSPNEMKTFSILQLRPLVERGDWSGECGRCFPRPLVPEALNSCPLHFPCGSRTAKAGPYRYYETGRGRTFESLPSSSQSLLPYYSGDFLPHSIRSCGSLRSTRFPE